jgi:hypothetical protein
VQVAVRVRRAVVVDNDVHSFNINTAPEDIRRDEDTLLEGLESLVSFDTGKNGSVTFSSAKCRYVPLLLLETGVDADTREVALHQKLVQFDATGNRLDEDDDLNGTVSS